MTNEELQAIFDDYASRHDGKLEAEGVEREVRQDRNHPLRVVLGDLMNDKQAAIVARVAAISGFIRRCRILITTETRSFKAPAYVVSPDSPTRTYEGIDRVIRDRSETDKRQIVVSEIVQVQRAINRVRALAIALEVEDQLRTVDAAIEALMERVRPSVGDAPAGRA